MENNQSNPEGDIYFAGFILRATEETIKKIKMHILTETDAHLILNKKDHCYLTITKASEK